MVTIKKGSIILTVTPGAYKEVYAPQGFREISESPTRPTETLSKTSEDIAGNFTEPAPENVTEDVLDISEDVPEVSIPEPQRFDDSEDLSEIPLNEMTQRQLRAYAKQLGVDISGLNSKRAVKDKIRSAL